MRITGGKYTNRKIYCPKGIIRPAMDRMRESMFAILGSLEGIAFLDMFSGSGIVGIEAASRGADPVVAVEMDHRKKPIILRNLGIAENKIKLVLMPAERFIKSSKRAFDVIYLDPPFNYKNKQRLLGLIDGSASVSEGTLVLLHHPAEDEIPERVGDLVLTDTRNYGRSVLRFFTYKPTSL